MPVRGLPALFGAHRRGPGEGGNVATRRKLAKDGETGCRNNSQDPTPRPPDGGAQAAPGRFDQHGMARSGRRLRRSAPGNPRPCANASLEEVSLVNAAYLLLTSAWLAGADAAPAAPAPAAPAPVASAPVVASGSCCGGGCGGGGCSSCADTCGCEKVKFWDKWRAKFHKDCGCETSCGCAAPAPSCGCSAPVHHVHAAPSCGCAAPAPSCGCSAPAHHVHAAPSCGCAAPAPSCGCSAPAQDEFLLDLRRLLQLWRPGHEWHGRSDGPPRRGRPGRAQGW
jgi:hypothetical protein